MAVKVVLKYDPVGQPTATVDLEAPPLNWKELTKTIKRSKIHDGIGYYADACVRPEFRRRGCQRALFNARLEAARQAGCELIFSIAEFADQSANNMEAFGLRMATETWHWTKSPHPSGISD